MNYSRGAGRGENPWNKNNFNNKTEQNWKNHQQNNGCTAESKFLIAQKEIQASVQKHLQRGYESSSSDEEDVESEPILKSVLKHYTQLNESGNGLERIRQFLENSFQSGAATCLICIATIKRIDPIWNCSQCFGFFHILCIQKWSKDSLFQQKKAQEDLPEFRKSKEMRWPCPKCRHEYAEIDVPQRYFCFCGKVQNPPHQPFLVPHSCGERCDKLLKPECGHSCLLLCHPGPCPPCPKMVQSSCHCNKEGPRMQRCSDKSWSCGSRCGKPLLCKKHFCEDSCHPNECSPCNKKSVQDCNCGLQKRKQPCMTPQWQCEKVCGKPFSCGLHSCLQICHRGSCGDCPRTQKRSCPCGKSVFQLPCTEEIPTCKETCGKLLECNVHYCQQKCHKDKCGTCLDIVMKFCRCTQHKKELPCQKEFLCGTKCKSLKNCLRHPCNRKCCDKNCPPCEKLCGRTLSCGNHKCPSICHSGQCYPCPEEVQIKCRCGATVKSVVCGREKKMKSPICNKLCTIPPNCHHQSREPHPCHYGECPPCLKICGKSRKTCSHTCPAQCHSAVWQKINENPSPAGPWEAAQYQYKRCNLPCPDCVVPVPVICFGGHVAKDELCYQAEPKSCLKPCGRLLKCGNHYCQKPCHKLLGDGDSIQAGEKCVECESICLKERPKGCIHKCPNPCHPGDCPPCTFSIKMKCHCGVSFMYIRCSDYFKACDETREALLSCGSKCPKNYPCGHLCSSNCHSGDCPDPEQCKKKVKVSCKCKNYKKDISCDVLRREGAKSLDCIESCFTEMNKRTKAKKLKIEKLELKENLKTNENEGKLQKGRKAADTHSSDLHAQYDWNIVCWYVSASVIVLVLSAAILYLG